VRITCASADRELANMLALATSPAALLFPQLIFHFRLDLSARPGGGPSLWVCIVMELVEALTDVNRSLVAGLVDAALRHVRRLHSLGLAHGDAHAGNVMYNERHLPGGAVGLQPLCIDADRVRTYGPSVAATGGLAALRK
jgi:hypothetical protein